VWAIDDIEEIIAQAKARRLTADATNALREIDDNEGLPEVQPKTDEGAFAKSAVGVTNAQHDAKEENIQQTHSNIKQSILSPVIEIAIISEAAKKENEAMKFYQTLDDLTRKENDIIVKEIGETHTDILQLLVSLDARGRDDANLNLNSLVAGEQARLSAQALGLNPQPGTQGFWGKMKGLIRLDKK
jgi:hypothetical protein